MADGDAEPDEGAGAGPAPAEDEGQSLWRLGPEGRNRWLLRRDGQPVAILGVLGTAEWWVTPTGEGLPWAETYGSRGAAVRAVVTWWLHTHPFGDA